MRTRRCGICGEFYQRNLFQRNNPHLQSVHPLFWSWLKKWRAILFGLVAVAIPILVVVDIVSLQSKDFLLLLLNNLIYAVGMEIFVIALPIKRRSVKRKWKKESGP